MSYAVETKLTARPLWRRESYEHSDKLQATLHAEYITREVGRVDATIEARIVDTITGDVLSTWSRGHWVQTVPRFDPPWLKAFAP